MAERGTAGAQSRHRREVDVAQPDLFVSHEAFAFEHAKLGAHGRVVRVPAEVGHHLGRGGPAAAVEDVHDLALAAAQSVLGVLKDSGHMLLA